MNTEHLQRGACTSGHERGRFIRPRGYWVRLRRAVGQMALTLAAGS
ncbi:hypothetical protein [Deinococcus apachensis]|nr:hypothetical protein [Deinococcus apachensis]